MRDDEGERENTLDQYFGRVGTAPREEDNDVKIIWIQTIVLK